MLIRKINLFHVTVKLYDTAKCQQSNLIELNLTRQECVVWSGPKVRSHIYSTYGTMYHKNVESLVNQVLFHISNREWLYWGSDTSSSWSICLLVQECDLFFYRKEKSKIKQEIEKSKKNHIKGKVCWSYWGCGEMSIISHVACYDDC